jgi:hypothetical protein
MGIFVDYPSNIFSAISNKAKIIVRADSNVLWVTSIIVCNKGAAPIRFFLQKVRLTGTSKEKTCVAATTVNLTATYVNGASGVGATLTNSGAFSVFSVDGVTPTLKSRILIKNQTNTFQNGIYVLTNVGSLSTSWVLTRAVDFDSAFEIQPGDAVSVTSGTVNNDTNWLQTATVTTVGVSPITFTTNTPSSIYYINELEIAPYKTVDIIDTTGVINLQYSVTPYISDRLVCFSNGYTQIFDCDVIYAQLNELPNF